MAHRSSPRRFRPSGVGSYTATSSHPFNRRFFDELDRRLAAAPPPARATLTVRLVNTTPSGADPRALPPTPTRA